MENEQHRSIMLQRKHRKLTYSQKWVPELRISGIWLENQGFHAGKLVEITSVQGALIIKAKV